MPQRTPLYPEHLKQHALMVDFAGWEMPLHYGSQIEEHHKVRQDAGMFDVSHMGVVDIVGADAKPYLEYLLANNVGKLKAPGKALYTCMLNREGGVIDDLIVYFISPTHYRLVVNAATREKDIRWLQQQATSFDVKILFQPSLAILAIQGPHACAKVSIAIPALKDKIAALKPFHFFQEKKAHTEHNILIARTGYTGEEGLEMIASPDTIVHYWKAFLLVGIAPIGLGARDTLRLEAGLNLYGQDMDETVSPLESNLAWTVALEPHDRQFIGREALEKQNQTGLQRKLVGLILLDKGVLRHHQRVLLGNEPVGTITSGTYSPTLKQAIALARVQATVEEDCFVEIRGKQLKAQIVQPPFVRR